MKTLPDWVGTHFEKVLGRLKKELTPEQIQVLYDRDGECPLCILCERQIPSPGKVSVQGREPGPSKFMSLAYCYHHINPRGMGGGDPNEPTNLAPICEWHHVEPIQSMTDLCRHAMIATGKSKSDDYPDLEWPDAAARLYPPVNECLGLWGFGSMIYRDGIPPLLQIIFTGHEDKRITDFCLHCCPMFKQCVQDSRGKFLRTLRLTEG